MSRDQQHPSLDRDQHVRVAGQLAHLRARFGDRYDETQWQAIERRLAVGAGKAAALRVVPLSNADEPEIVFAPARQAGDPQ